MPATATLESQQVSPDNPRVRHVSGGESRFRRRTSRPDLRLDFSNIPRYQCKPILIKDPVEEEGCMLYRDFLRQQLDKKGLDVPNQSILTPADRVDYGCRNPGWIIRRKHMQQMCASFETTQPRTQLQHQCNHINTSDMQKEAYCDFLKDLFSANGKTRENVVILFVFSSDLMLRSADNAEHFDQFLKWTLDFIEREVCPWVRENGGWDQVLDNSFQHFPKIVAAATIALLAVMSYRWFSRLL